jgi:aldose 1-epimerase
MTTPLSGIQYDLVHGEYRASIASVGASLRELTYAGRHLVTTFDADEVRPVFRGATLAPWPNRIVDGKYTFAGIEQQVALTEPSRSHALHGLVAWTSFECVASSESHVVLATTIEAQSGYPHRVRVEVTFELTAAGLYSAVTATNEGTDAAPFGTGPHPYLVAGDGRVDDWTLTLPTQRVLTVTPDRLIPIVTVNVDDTDFDFREPRAIGDTFIDHALTGVTEARVTLTAPDGSGVVMTWDDACPWVQVHTADQPDVTSDRHRSGLAVEPMTCPPDAFNSGIDLLVLEPGQSTTAGWTISNL